MPLYFNPLPGSLPGQGAGLSEEWDRMRNMIFFIITKLFITVKTFENMVFHYRIN
jgi:hypothetical protein